MPPGGAAESSAAIGLEARVALVEVHLARRGVAAPGLELRAAVTAETQSKHALAARSPTHCDMACTVPEPQRGTLRPPAPRRPRARRQQQQERARGRRGSNIHVCLYILCLGPRVVETTEIAMPKYFRARMYTRRKSRICQILKNVKLVVKLLETIFLFCQIF